ncbi:hypothetical protein LSH36_535g01007 [Paralvinella palmiformis]|uniref:Integrase catalytic domain-containing protein n=1 Tax=Paralvinella palmiformis TaxID=53620 RepID=A0AAD9MW96_9ANNE|nr:hypothetical protein LSH36_535g01007 [Paralvinella palmiformis]
MHPGIVRMKSIARSFMWWPGIDSDIEEMVQSCSECLWQRHAPPAVSFSPWLWVVIRLWQRVHVDFAEKKVLIEVLIMNSTTAGSIVTELRKLFDAYGLLQSVVSDNRPQFTLEEFETFLKLNGVKHVLCPPYHQASNGLTERNVQTFNNMLANA